MGKFACRCGYRLGGSPPEPGTGFETIADEDFEAVVLPGLDEDQRLYRTNKVAAAFRSLSLCPNCGRLHWERNDESGRIDVFVRSDGYPRVWADLSDRDELGRVLLRSERSLADIRRQNLLLRPPVRLVLYQDDVEFTGEAHFGLRPSGELDETLWAVILDVDAKERNDRV